MEVIAEEVRPIDAEVAVVKGTLKEIPLSMIVANAVSLRGVDHKDPKFLNLVESVKLRGVLQPIQVRPAFDPETGEEKYSLINGLQRYTAAQMCGYDTIQCSVRGVNDLQVLEEQLITNTVDVTTKPYQIGKQLKQILALDPSKSINSLAVATNMSVATIKQRLRMTELSEDIGKLVDEGRITVLNAATLAELDPEDYDSFLAQASGLPHNEFAALVKERKDAKRKARLAQRPDEPIFNAEPALRKFSEIKEGRANIELATKITEDSNAKTPVDGFMAAMNWVVNMDPATMLERRAIFDKKIAEDKAKREKASELRAERSIKVNEIKTQAAKLKFTLIQEGKLTPEEIEKQVKDFIEAETEKLKN